MIEIFRMGMDQRNPGKRGLNAAAVEIRKQIQFQSGKETHHIHGFIVIDPGHTVGGAAVQAAVRG